MSNRSSLDESTLLKQCEAGDERAFSKLTGRYKDALYFRILQGTQDKGEAKDVLQEALINTWLGLTSKKFDGEHAFSTWFFRIGHNVLVDHHRKYVRKRKQTVSLNDPINFSDGEDSHERITGIVIPEDSMLDSIIKEEAEFKPQPMLDELSEELRTMITLRHFQEFTYEEIATFMGKLLGTIKSSLWRARQQLLELAKDHHVPAPAA